MTETITERGAVDDLPSAQACEISWHPSPMTSTLAACTAVALTLAILTGRWQLVLFAAPLIGVLIGAAEQRGHARVWITDEREPVRSLESETATLAVSVASSASAMIVRLSPTRVDGLQIDLEQPTAPNEATIGVCAQRWGRYTISLDIHTVSKSGFFVGAPITLPAGELRVYPVADPHDVEVPCGDLPDRIGTHLTRHHGPGVEHADIREYVPGDSLRTANWRVSARYGRLHVTDRFTDRAADVVILIDTHPQPSGPATTATARSAHGATQIAQSVLQAGDHAGIVMLGRAPRWLAPDIGRRQFYRILDAILDVGEWHSPGVGTLAPRASVPPNAIVVAFSTLLNAEFGLALIDLRRRGHPVVVVDVLDRLPFLEEIDPIIERWWRLERSRMYGDIAVSGVDVIPWEENIGLQHAMRPMSSRPQMGRRR